MASKRNAPNAPNAPKAPKAPKARPAPKRGAAPPPEAGPTTEPRAAPPKAEKDTHDARWRAAEERLSVRLAVLEDVVRRSSQETRAARAEVSQLKDAHGELWRRVSEVEKRGAAKP